MSLKYLLPLLIFLAGLFLVTLQTYIHAKNEYATMIRYSTGQAKVVGNRLASRITFEVRNQGLSEQKMISLTAPYMADTLDLVDLYDQKMASVFSRNIPSYKNGKTDDFNNGVALKVIKDQFSNVAYVPESRHIIGYFPIDLPVRKGDVLSRHTGVLYLVFDVSAEYIETRQNIIKFAVMNLIIVITMVLLISMLLYFFIFKRLNALHKGTEKLAGGNFNVHVQSKGDDELTQVIHTFNTMALQMDAYKHTMEESVERALKERGEQTKMLIQQSRMASMGEMIGNIAHQWRQPLNALSIIIQKIQIFSERGKLTPEKLDESVNSATTLINNMSSTIDDFRDFFKPDKHKEHFELKDIIHEVMLLLDASFKENNIHVHINIDQPHCELFGFKNEFSQVVINLLNNSKDALLEREVEEGHIYIRGEQMNDKVLFTISDNAGGIPEEIIDRIFDPYYTTKDEGKGTGIGLYMSKMIIEENMHGNMQVKNSDTGAEFTMIFRNEKR